MFVLQEFIDAADNLIKSKELRKYITKNALTQIHQKHNLQNEHKAYTSLFETLNALRPKFRPPPIMEEEEEENEEEQRLEINSRNGNHQDKEKEEIFEELTASSTTMNLAAVAAANSVALEPKPRLLRRKMSKVQLHGKKGKSKGEENTGETGKVDKKKGGEKTGKGSHLAHLKSEGMDYGSDSSVQSNDGTNKSNDSGKHGMRKDVLNGSGGAAHLKKKEAISPRLDRDRSQSLKPSPNANRKTSDGGRRGTFPKI